MQYQKLSDEQRDLRSARNWVWARATTLQREAEEQGKSLSRKKAVQQAWGQLRRARARQ